MLTPAFELHQDERFLYILIKAPFAKIDETEIFMEDFEFKFYSKPYYLRLTLPGKIIEDGQETAKYEVDKGEFRIRATKVTVGELFDGLDMLTKLLAPAGKTSAQGPAIEVLDSEVQGEQAEEGDVVEEDFDWQIEQQPYIEETINVGGPKYGFANQRIGVLKRMQEELVGVIDLPDADLTPSGDRAKLRMADEQERFDEDHYLADFYDDELIMGLIMYKPPWADEYMKLRDDPGSLKIEFTEEEKERMLKLPRKEYLLDGLCQQQVFLGIVDLLFAYAYNHRTTEGESTVESAWTVAKLSATLSWFQSYHSVEDVAITCYRRSLCYPLYRHWKLASKVWNDVCRILTVGKQRMVKCLLDLHGLLAGAEGHYILNDLYVTDYCVWLQGQSSKTIESLSQKVHSVKLTKSDLELDLEVLELAGSLAATEQHSTNQIAEHISSLSISDSPSANENPCQKCSPQSQPPIGSPVTNTLDESFPNADLELASSTDSCSSSSDSESESETDSESEQISDIHKDVKNLSVITELDEANTSDLRERTEGADLLEDNDKLSKAKTDSATLNF